MRKVVRATNEDSIGKKKKQVAFDNRRKYVCLHTSTGPPFAIRVFCFSFYLLHRYTARLVFFCFHSRSIVFDGLTFDSRCLAFYSKSLAFGDCALDNHDSISRC